MAVEIVGSLNVDIILDVEALPRPGETILSRGLSRMPGGKGANQAIAAARMGAATQMVGAVGRDENGQWMTGILAESGVDTSAILSLEAHTGTAHIAVDAAGENQIIVSLGANGALEAAMLQAPAVERRVILAQLETPVATVAARFADAPDCTRILNTAPAVPGIDSLIALTDILILNEHELASYRPDAQADAVAAARALLTRPDQVAIVTLGAQGALAVWPERDLHVPAFPVTPIDTIGAGDCFCGALAALIDEGMALESALPLANAAAALCTQARGAAPAMPERAQVEAFARSASA